MRFLNVHLSNYIGIYNGMGLYDINIDFTKCRNRMVIIRGDNGSGKSTLSKAMNLFPDGSDNFIPGMAARKEITLMDGPTVYLIRFIHGVKNNGEREVTKAYITKTFDGIAVELNENGNVSSYKEILYNEFGLDANFIALSQLSTEDRGLADKKPAERKRFVNSIISSLDTYNNIYKTLNKRASNFKSIINSIVSKLRVLGDEATVTSNLEAVETKINSLTDKKDQAVTSLAKAQSTIQILDPDGTIQNTNTLLSAELDLAEKEYKRLQAVIDSLIMKLPNGANDVDFRRASKAITDKKNSTIIECQILRGKVDTLLSQKEQRALELNKKIQRLNQLNSGESYESIVDGLQRCQEEIANIRSRLLEVGISDPASISKDEYILALETLNDLSRYISVFKSNVDFSIIEGIVQQYIDTGTIPTVVDISHAQNSIDQIRKDIECYKARKRNIEAQYSLLDKLALRPSDCTISECPFIKEALAFSVTGPVEEASDLAMSIQCGEDTISMHQKYIADAMVQNEAISRFSVIVREVNKNAKILSKLRNGDMFKNPRIFFENLMNGYTFEYMQDIYRYIDLANLFDTYKAMLEVEQRYQIEIQEYHSKTELLEEIQSEINGINAEVSKIVDQIAPIMDQVEDLERDIGAMTELEAIYTAIIENKEQQAPILEKIKDRRRTLSENANKINQIGTALFDINRFRESINRLTYELEPLMKERDKLLHSKSLITEYTQELEETRKNHEFIETIKFYSSPTTGIQLVFMELYMGKIIALANELLSFLFNGKFVIQPFVINESEFRIPCLGDGYLNDDISSMSSSQIGMISMILSFALLHHSSSKYNIIKLDEIDGPLDYNNRLYFMDVLEKIMNIMNTEQCIMISHNSELQVDNSDVILLRHDESNMDYQRGNIIWSF